MATPLMPKATAVWLVDNTTLSFAQISEFCGLHDLEIQAIADGEVAIGMVGRDPIANGELTKEEIARCEADPTAHLRLQVHNRPQPVTAPATALHPVAKRQEARCHRLAAEEPSSCGRRESPKLSAPTEHKAIRDRALEQRQHQAARSPWGCAACATSTRRWKRRARRRRAKPQPRSVPRHWPARTARPYPPRSSNRWSPHRRTRPTRSIPRRLTSRTSPRPTSRTSPTRTSLTPTISIADLTNKGPRGKRHEAPRVSGWAASAPGRTAHVHLARRGKGADCGATHGADRHARYRRAQQRAAPQAGTGADRAAAQRAIARRVATGAERQDGRRQRGCRTVLRMNFSG